MKKDLNKQQAPDVGGEHGAMNFNGELTIKVINKGKNDGKFFKIWRNKIYRFIKKER